MRKTESRMLMLLCVPKRFPEWKLGYHPKIPNSKKNCESPNCAKSNKQPKENKLSWQ